jgi:CheY-like chemotaxis protein
VSEPRPKRILVVDDDEDVQVLVCRILRDAGFEVDSAHDGATALGGSPGRRPDLVVLDLMMPGIDGWGVLERMRDMPKPPPVVVLTARTDFGTFTRRVREGLGLRASPSGSTSWWRRASACCWPWRRGRRPRAPARGAPAADGRVRVLSP